MSRRKWRFTSRELLIAMTICAVLIPVAAWWIDALVHPQNISNPTH
jgi:Tfp pilus assembly protein FimT